MNVNKKALIDRVTPQLGSRRAAAEAVEVVLDTIARTLAEGSSVSVTGFGVFEPAERASRLARNPQTGDRVTIPARRVPCFRPHQRLKDLTDGRRPLPTAGSSIRKDPKGTHMARDAA